MTLVKYVLNFIPNYYMQVAWRRFFQFWDPLSWLGENNQTQKARWSRNQEG